MAYKINKDECIGCGACAAACPCQCINEDNGVYVINSDECVSCGNCNANCPLSLPTEE